MAQFKLGSLSLTYEVVTRFESWSVEVEVPQKLGVKRKCLKLDILLIIKVYLFFVIIQRVGPTTPMLIAVKNFFCFLLLLFPPFCRSPYLLEPNLFDLFFFKEECLAISFRLAELGPLITFGAGDKNKTPLQLLIPSYVGKSRGIQF